MATEKDTPETSTPGTPQAGAEQFAALIGQAVATAVEAQNPKKVTPGRYNPNTPWQPDKNKMKKLARKCYQNGILVDDGKLNNVDIDLWNRITHSGRYCNRLVEVIVNEDGSETYVNLRYNNKGDHRFVLKDQCKNLTDMLTQVVDAQELEDAEQDALEEKKVAARRKFGENKAFKEAQAKAEASK